MGRQRAAATEKQAGRERAAAAAKADPAAKATEKFNADAESLRGVERVEIPEGLNVSHVRFAGAIQICGVPREDIDAKRRGVAMTLVGGLLYVEQITLLGPSVNGRQKQRREVAAVPITSVRVITFPPEVSVESVVESEDVG